MLRSACQITVYRLQSFCVQNLMSEAIIPYTPAEMSRDSDRSSSLPTLPDGGHRLFLPHSLNVAGCVGQSSIIYGYYEL